MLDKLFAAMFSSFVLLFRTPSIRMISSRKTSAQQSRNSFAMDDRASQNFTTADQNNRNSVAFVSNVADERTEHHDMSIDHLKKFETTEFPPEPPLDASRTSLAVTDDDFSENDRTENRPSESVEENQEAMVVDEKPASEQRYSLVPKKFLLPTILGLLVLFIAVILEMKLNILSSG